jgi:hypothetical protein
VDKQQAVFFLLRVSTEVAQAGLALRCFSANKSRFKLVVFDKKGSVRYLVSAPTYNYMFNHDWYEMHVGRRGFDALSCHGSAVNVLYKQGIESCCCIAELRTLVYGNYLSVVSSATLYSGRYYAIL